MLRRRVKVFPPMHDSSIRTPPSRISQLFSPSVVSAKKENAKKAWAQKVKET
jgi:hypothetical protein